MSYQIVRESRCQYAIVCARNADETTRYAANELQKYLYRCTGASAAIMSDISPCIRLSVEPQPEIRIGPDVRRDPYYAEIDFDALGDEGFLIRTHGEHIYITGKTSRGTLYGVYEFLERFLGCHWYAPGVDVLPFNRNLTIPDTDFTDKPAFEYRDAYWGCAFDGDFCAHNRLNSAKAVISPEQGGKMRFYNFHHACLDLVPEADYFAEHPEYYAMRDGERKPTQLCLSNPEVRRIAAQTLRRWIAENPYATVFSIAQNDNQEYCTCPECRKLDEAEGSPCASLIDFANALADDIAKDFPHVLLHTFAYQYSVVPPKTLRPRKNVIVRLCNIGADFSKPYTEGAKTDERTKEFVNSLNIWNGRAERLYIWDYCVNFVNYLLPFPNLECLQPNLQMYRDCGVRGVFMEGDFSHGCAAFFCELQAYLQARLLWNPDCDYEAEMDGFLNAYYGKGAPFVKEFIGLMNERARAVPRMSIYQWPDFELFTDEFTAKGLSLFTKAALAAENEQVRCRVERTALGVEYLYLVRLPMETAGRNDMIDAFGEKLRKFRVTEITERGHLDEAIEGMKPLRYGKAMRRDGQYYHMYYRM